MQRPVSFAALLLAGSLLLPTASRAADPATATAAPAKRPFTFEDMMALKRVNEPVPSPDGAWVVFAATDVNLEANTKRSHLWIVPAAGGDSRRLNPDTDNDESRPRFSPKGDRLIFTSKAGDEPQIWSVGFDPASGAFAGKPHPLTALSTGADGGTYSPDGANVIFTSRVYPDAKDDAANKTRDEALKNSKVKAQLFTRLFYRHWTDYTDFKRSHLFVVSANADASQPAPNTQPAADAPRDLTPGDHDMPPFSLGGQDDYTISPDGKEVAYTSNVDAVEATSTNNEIFLVPITGGAPKKISTSPGSDSSPLYSPDGKSIAWRSQARAGFESDKFTLIVYDRAAGTTRDITAGFDNWVDNYVWAADSKSIYFTAPDRGEEPIYWTPNVAGQNFKPEQIARLHADDLALSPNGEVLFFSRASIMAPNEIARVELAGLAAARDTIKQQYQQQNGLTGVGVRVSVLAGQPVTHVNDALLSQISMQPLENFNFTGADNAQVQGFLVKPPGFDPNKKYPLKFLIHGGPQGDWSDSWSYRWNVELFAASGYVSVMINPHGSTGYGQAFTDAVSGDWGGKPYEDLMKGLDYAEATYPFIDKTREAALGASYGGYMINWILGHTDRFRCLVSHDGLFNAEAAYGATEELWFNEWEYRGTPWENREMYLKWSPHLHAKDFKTPTLVIHGQLDYRLDVSQGFDLFTTLQRLGVPSEMLYFPDEGHWVLKPQNSRLWNRTVSDWVDRWTAPR